MDLKRSETANRTQADINGPRIRPTEAAGVLPQTTRNPPRVFQGLFVIQQIKEKV